MLDVITFHSQSISFNALLSILSIHLLPCTIVNLVEVFDKFGRDFGKKTFEKDSA